jgi:6-phosphofructokinase 1
VGYRRFVRDEGRVLYDIDAGRNEERVRQGQPLVAFELAGPRELIFFDPTRVKAALVTSGGLCPGLNSVIRAIAHELASRYGVRHIKGVRYGFAGLNPTQGWPLLDLEPDVLASISSSAGSFLGTSRGPQPVDVMVDTLQREEINVLFVIGGDGSLRGALALHKEVHRRGLPIAVVGIPKTIDNDINIISRTFGFQTAVAEAVETVRCAHTEAEGVVNGIGIVKLMGRHSGFVAATAALAQAEVDFVLIPEVPFELEGPQGLLAALEARIERHHHAVIVVAEGAGQHLFPADLGTDSSGNPLLGDVGLLLREEIVAYFRQRGLPVAMKYIDPSYLIRGVPANANDRVFCAYLGQQAVHAAMAGKTGVVVGNWNNVFVHVPIEATVKKRKQVDPNGTFWLSVLAATGQPEYLAPHRA